MTETVKMWSVRQAVTKGRVVEIEGVLNGRRIGGRQTFKPDCWSLFVIGEDVFHTRDEAETLARQNVAKRRASLERSLAALAKNPFNVEDGK